MSKREYPAIHVINTMRGFQSRELPYKITPHRFQLPDGRSYRVRKIRQMTTQKVGQALHYHFVVQTEDERYFHLVLDSASLVWRMVQEVDEALFFHG